VTTDNPIRFPDVSSPEVMTWRGWRLVGLNILIPGSAQMLAGNRKLGRFAVVTTFVLWAFALVAVVTTLVSRQVAISIVTNSVVLWVLQIAFLFYGVLWILLALNTVRLVRLVRVRGNARGPIAALAIFALILTTGIAGYGVVVTGSARGALESVFAGSQIAPPINGRYNILLLGGDAGPDRLGMRPDSISVVSIDAAAGAATIIGIPRNLEQVPFVAGSPMYGPYPNGFNCGDNCLVNALYTYGEAHAALYPKAEKEGSSPGIEAERDAVEAVTGLTLQYYVLIDMQGFSDLIQALGGLTIDVPHAVLLGKNGDPPIGKIAAGVQKMDGPTALWYARTRYNTTDYDRMARQRQVQEAVLAQIQPEVMLTKFQAIASAGAQVVKTDIPSSMLGYFVDLAGKSRKLPVTTLELVPPTVVTAHPNFDEIRSLVAAAVAPPAASPTPAN
jgi:polyisoprenyl-teichoic acid--peptidoglycan teichoic acid transferase